MAALMCSTASGPVGRWSLSMSAFELALVSLNVFEGLWVVAHIAFDRQAQSPTHALQFAQVKVTQLHLVAGDQPEKAIFAVIFGGIPRPVSIGCEVLDRRNGLKPLLLLAVQGR